MALPQGWIGTRVFERDDALYARAGSERAADRDIREPEKQPGPAPSGARVSVRHRACGGDVVKKTPHSGCAPNVVEHEMQMKCELTLHEPRELTLCVEHARIWNGVLSETEFKPRNTPNTRTQID